PRNKRMTCFTPEPVDVVNSIGVTRHKMIENENAVMVAYMMSGNIAVFDDDVRRYVDFLERLGYENALERRRVDTLARRVHEFLERKRPGEVDISEVQDIKRIIRESEAVSGLET